MTAWVLLLLSSVPDTRLSTSQFASQYGTVRAMQELPAKEGTSGVDRGVADLVALDKSLPNRIRTRSGGELVEGQAGRTSVKDLYWRTIDALVFSSGSPDRLKLIPQIMPTIGGYLDSTKAVEAVLKALDDSKADFDHRLWPLQEKEAQARIASFEAIPAAKRAAAVRFVLDAAGIVRAPDSVDVLVLDRMAGKEGMTVRTRSGTLVVIGSDKYRGADFAEVVIHECTHVLDTFAGEDSLFGKLRSALKAAKRSDFEIEQVPHTAMFLLAAEAVRREIDPNHVDVGKTFGAYSRGLEPLRRVVEPQLLRLAERKAGADEVVRAIVAGLSARKGANRAAGRRPTGA